MTAMHRIQPLNNSKQKLMSKRFLKQLLPFGILAGLFFATGTKAGINPMGKAWLYSCTFSVGGSVGVDGFHGIAPSHEPVGIIGSQANLANYAMGCN